MCGCKINSKNLAFCVFSFWSLLTRSMFLCYLHCYSAWHALEAGEGLINVGFYIDKCGCEVLLTHGNVGGCLEKDQLLCDSSVPVPSFEYSYETRL